MSTEMVNGYVCRDCTDVANAKKFIDPAKPDDGPFGRDAKDKMDAKASGPAVTFGGALAFLNDTGRVNSLAPGSDAAFVTGRRTGVDLSA